MSEQNDKHVQGPQDKLQEVVAPSAKVNQSKKTKDSTVTKHNVEKAKLQNKKRLSTTVAEYLRLGDIQTHIPELVQLFQQDVNIAKEILNSIQQLMPDEPAQARALLKELRIIPKALIDQYYKLISNFPEDWAYDILLNDLTNNGVINLVPESMYLEGLRTKKPVPELSDKIRPEILPKLFARRPQLWTITVWNELKSEWKPNLFENLLSLLDSMKENTLPFILIIRLPLEGDDRRKRFQTLCKAEILTALNNFLAANKIIKEDQLSLSKILIEGLENWCREPGPILQILGQLQLDMLPRLVQIFFVQLVNDRAAAAATLAILVKHQAFSKEDIPKLFEVLSDHTYFQLWDEIVKVFNSLDSEYIHQHFADFPKLTRAYIALSEEESDGKAQGVDEIPPLVVSQQKEEHPTLEQSSTAENPSFEFQQWLDKTDWTINDCRQVQNQLEFLQTRNACEDALKQKLLDKCFVHISTYSGEGLQQEAWSELINDVWEELLEWLGNPWDVFRWQYFSEGFVKQLVELQHSEYHTTCSRLLRCWEMAQEFNLSKAASLARSMLMDYISEDARSAGDFILNINNKAMAMTIVADLILSIKELKYEIGCAKQQKESLRIKLVAKLSGPIAYMEQIAAVPGSSKLGSIAEQEIAARAKEIRQALESFGVFQLCPLGCSTFDPTIHEPAMLQGSEVIVLYAGMKLITGTILQKARVIPLERGESNVQDRD